MKNKSRYVGYMNGMKKLKNQRNRISTKKSVLSKLNSLKNEEFSMTIPIAEGSSNEH